MRTNWEYQNSPTKEQNEKYKNIKKAHDQLIIKSINKNNMQKDHRIPLIMSQQQHSNEISAIQNYQSIRKQIQMQSFQTYHLNISKRDKTITESVNTIKQPKNKTNQNQHNINNINNTNNINNMSNINNRSVIRQSNSVQNIDIKQKNKKKRKGIILSTNLYGIDKQQNMNNKIQEQQDKPVFVEDNIAHISQQKDNNIRYDKQEQRKQQNNEYNQHECTIDPINAMQGIKSTSKQEQQEPVHTQNHNNIRPHRHRKKDRYKQLTKLMSRYQRQPISQQQQTQNSTKQKVKLSYEQMKQLLDDVLAHCNYQKLTEQQYMAVIAYMDIHRVLDINDYMGSIIDNNTSRSISSMEMYRLL